MLLHVKIDVYGKTELPIPTANARMKQMENQQERQKLFQ